MSITDLVTDELAESSLYGFVRRVQPGLAQTQVDAVVQKLIARNRIGTGDVLHPGALLQYRPSDLPAVIPPIVVPPVTPHGPRPFSDSSAWNTPILPGQKWAGVVPANTGTDPNGIGHWYLSGDNASEIYAAPSDPLWTLTLKAINDPAKHRVTPGGTVQVRGPVGLVAGADSDHVMALVQPDGSMYETWLTVINASKRTITCLAYGMGNTITGSGCGVGNMPGGVRSANFSTLAGRISAADMAAGKIDHALAVALQDTLDPANYIAPATASEGSHGNGSVPNGQRLGIPAGTKKPEGLTKIGSMVWDALAMYGGFVGDWTGGGQYPMLYAQPGAVVGKDSDDLIAFWAGCDMNRIAPYIHYAAA